MKVILLQNIKSLGIKGALKEVSDGYALNFLLPKKLAVAANQSKVLMAEQQKKSLILKQEKNEQAIEKIIAKIAHKKIIIQKSASAKGKLFAGVSEGDIGLALKEKFNLEIASEKIKIREHLKELGEHKLDLVIDHRQVPIIVEIKNV